MQSLLATLACLAVIFCASPACSQSIWTAPQSTPHLSVEALKPFFAKEDASLLSSTWFVTGEYPLRNQHQLVFEVPFTYLNSEKKNVFQPGVSAAAFGNPYVGLKLGSAEESTFTELGIRVPVSSGNRATITGNAADYATRPFAFGDDLASGHLMINRTWNWSSAWHFRFRTGPTVAFRLGSAAPSVYAKYGGQVWHDAGLILAGAGLSGLAFVIPGETLADRTQHTMTFTLIGNFETVRPGALIRAPINGSLGKSTGLVLGLTLSVPLR